MLVVLRQIVKINSTELAKKQISLALICFFYHAEVDIRQLSLLTSAILESPCHMCLHRVLILEDPEAPRALI